MFSKSHWTCSEPPQVGFVWCGWTWTDWVLTSLPLSQSIPMGGSASPSSTLQATTRWDMRAAQRGGVQSRVWRRSYCLWSACWQSRTMKVERTSTPLKCGGRTESSSTNSPRRSYASRWAFRDDVITLRRCPALCVCVFTPSSLLLLRYFSPRTDSQHRSIKIWSSSS